MELRLLKNLKAYLNPFIPSGGYTQTIFHGLTPDVRIRILNMSGELVAERGQLWLQERWLWNVKNKEGEEIARRIYIYLATNSACEKRENCHYQMRIHKLAKEGIVSA